MSWNFTIERDQNEVDVTLFRLTNGGDRKKEAISFRGDDLYPLDADVAMANAMFALKMLDDSSTDEDVSSLLENVTRGPWRVKIGGEVPIIEGISPDGVETIAYVEDIALANFLVARVNAVAFPLDLSRINPSP